MPAFLDVPARRRLLAAGLALLTGPVKAAGTRSLLQVGPQRRLKRIGDAAGAAPPGALVEVDAGEYRGDTAVWTQPGLTLRAVGGRVRLVADGAAAEGKGIWVVRAQQVLMEGFDFEDCRVPARNGAGVRFERGSLRVRNCRFLRNEMGLLTGNDPDSVLQVEHSEFAFNLRPDGHNHQLYVGGIARLLLRGCRLHHGHIGHLLKSRAAISEIVGNQLADGPDGRASYEMEFPNGGEAYVTGNTLQQDPNTQNPKMLAFGAEGYRGPLQRLHLAYNTFVDGLPGGQGEFVALWPGADVDAQAWHNVYIGPGRVPEAMASPSQGNRQLPLDTLQRAGHEKGEAR